MHGQANTVVEHGTTDGHQAAHGQAVVVHGQAVAVHGRAVAVDGKTMVRKTQNIFQFESVQQIIFFQLAAWPSSSGWW